MNHSAPLDDYLSWNQFIADSFFNKEANGRTVYLAIDEDTLREVGQEKDDLAIVTLAEAEARNCTTILTLALQLHDEWRREINYEDSENAPTPTFIAVLALFVLAVNHGDTQWPAHAFYDRLHDLLGEPDAPISTLQQSEPLWIALEHWTTRYKKRRHGVFRALSVGNHRWVGIPRRQILLSPREQDALPHAFLQAHLTSDSDPSDRRLLRAATGSKGLLSRTRRLLDKWPEDDAACELLEEIRYRLESCEFGESLFIDGHKISNLHLRLILSIRRTTFTAAYFGTTRISALKETSKCLLVSHENSTAEPNSSFFLDTNDTVSNNAIILDGERRSSWATQVSWFTDLSFRIKETEIAIVRPATQFIVLTISVHRNIWEEVSHNHLEPSKKYLMLAEVNGFDSKPNFVAEFLSDWKICNLVSGVQYRTFRAATPKSAEKQQLHIRWIGGIPSEPGRRSFLHFGRPRIAVSSLGTLSPDINVRIKAVNENGNHVSAKLEEVERNADDKQLEQEHFEKIFRISELSEFCVRCDVHAATGKFDAHRMFLVDHEPFHGETAEPLSRDALGLPCNNEVVQVFRGLDIRSDKHPTRSTLPVTSRPFDCEKRVKIDYAAGRVMQLMRTRHRLNWSNAKTLLVGCVSGDTSQIAYARKLTQVVRTLHSLGIIELEENTNGGISAITELPPKIVLLPTLANMGHSHQGGYEPHQCILTGCWLPDQLLRLKVEAKKQVIDLHTGKLVKKSFIIPRPRFLLTVGPQSFNRFHALAQSLDVDFTGEYSLAGRMAEVFADIHSITESLEWVSGKPASSYVIRFFEPHTLCISQKRPLNGDRYELWECRSQDIPIWHFFVVDRDRVKHIKIADRQLARWFVRRMALPETPIPTAGSTIVVPEELRLPSALERMVVLSSGRTPQRKRYRNRSSPFIKNDVSKRFAIPPPNVENDVTNEIGEVCSGDFFCYQDAYGTQAWAHGELMPMLQIASETITKIGLEVIE